MTEKPQKDLSEAEQIVLLWRSLQAFCLAFVVTGGLLALAVGPLLDKPHLAWTGLIPATPALGVMLWAQTKIVRLRKLK